MHIANFVQFMSKKPSRIRPWPGILKKFRLFNVNFHFKGPECTEEAVIESWRVTICKANDQNDSENKECQNHLYKIQWISRMKWRHRGFLELVALDKCQLYTVAITPTHR